ncbi:helicase [Aphelenchoides avenae]|nr:helicase [Aphelenchus avenae]
MELNTRLKRLIMLYQRQAELRASEALKITRWPKHEEVDLMRVLRVCGEKDDSNSANVINWTRFRELTTCLQKKTDAEMCTKQQGNELSQVDQRRAACVDAISAQKAEKLMNRLHLMRKIHAIITTGIHHVRNSLKLCSTEHMPSGRGELHDEQLLIIVDKWGLDRIAPRIAQLPAFEKICTTLETGRWNGIASTEMIEDEETSLMDTMTQQSIAMLQKAVDAAVAAARGAQSRRGRRKNAAGTGRGAAATSSVLSMNNASAGLDLAEIEKEKMRALMHESFLQKMEEAAAAMSQNYASAMLPLMGLASGSSSSSSAQQQQLQQLQALFALSALTGATPGTSTASLASVTDDVLNLSKKATWSSQKAAGATATATVTATKPISCATPSSSANASSANAQLSPLNQLNIADLLALANLPLDTNIPVVSTETGQRLTGVKAPKIKYLEQWLKDHPKYSSTCTGIAHPADKWPTLTNLVAWLDKNQDSNVQTAYISLAKVDSSKSPDASISRNESVKRCIQSLVHACQCRDANCRRPTCHKMKKIVQHTKLCKKRQQTNCPVCKQLIALCCYHAKQCNLTMCPVQFGCWQKLQERKRSQNRLADLMMRRRMEKLQAGGANGASSIQSSSHNAPAHPTMQQQRQASPHFGNVPSPTNGCMMQAHPPGMQQHPTGMMQQLSGMQQNMGGNMGGMSQAPQGQQFPQQHMNQAEMGPLPQM